jgi:hypothetical protein
MKKRTIIRLLAAIVLFVLTPCAENFCYGQNKSFAEIIEELQSDLPIQLGSLGEITGVSISEGNLLMICNANEDVVDIPTLQKDPDLMKTNLKQWMAGSNSDFGIFFDNLTLEGLGLKVLYIGKESGDSASCVLTNDEIRERESLMADYDPKKFLDEQIRIANEQLSSEKDEGIYCTKIVRKGKYVVYYFLCKEPEFDMKLMKKIRSTMHTMALESLNSDKDVSITEFRRSCKNANVGIAYYYIGEKSGITVKILVPANELR